jgi:hypothetical protein
MATLFENIRLEHKGGGEMTNMVNDTQHNDIQQDVIQHNNK